jgi:hypothetical protein
MDRITSEKMNEANRANAQLSTGPITEEGKARSSQNARVHGLCAKQLFVADDEESKILASLQASLEAELKPVGEMEFIHFEAIVHAQWNLRRCRMNEAIFLASGPDAFLDPNQRKALNTLSTYAARHERALHRATKELKALQFERALRTNCGDADGIEPSPLVETVRVRRSLLAEMRAKIGLDLSSFDDAREDDNGEPSEPINDIDRLLVEPALK